MQLDISKCIADYLIRNDSISLPGIGILNIYDLNHDFVQIGDEIIPPRKSIRFSNEIDGISNFESYLANSLGIPFKKASGAVKDYSRQILEEISKSGSYKIDGIGTFSKGEGNTLIFKALENNFHPKFAFYPALKLTPLVASEEIEEEKEEESFNILEEPKTSEIELIETSEEKIGKVSAIGKENVPENIERVHQAISKTEPMAYNEPNQNQNYYDEPEKGLFSHIGVPLLWLVLLALLVFFLLRWAGCGTADSMKNAASDIVDTVGDTKDDVVDATLDLVNGETSTDFGKYNNILTDEIVAQGCVIIVGSFKRNRNAIRMRDKIINLGYQPYEEPIKGYNRVGIVIDCLERDLVEVIQEVRRTIEPKAWYRIPGFRVPYE